MGRHSKRRPVRLRKPVIVAATTTVALAAGGTGTALAAVTSGTAASSGTVAAQLTSYTKYNPYRTDYYGQKIYVPEGHCP